MKTLTLILAAITLQGCAALESPATKCAASKLIDFVVGHLCVRDDTYPSGELPEPLPEPEDAQCDSPLQK